MGFEILRKKENKLTILDRWNVSLNVLDNLLLRAKKVRRFLRDKYAD